MDNGSNVCGTEFNYNGDSKGITGQSAKHNTEEEDSKSIIGDNESEQEVIYNDQIFRQLFLGLEVVSEEGRSVHDCQ